MQAWKTLVHVGVKGAIWAAEQAGPSLADYRKFGKVRENMIFSNLVPSKVMNLTNKESL